MPVPVNYNIMLYKTNAYAYRITVRAEEHPAESG